MSIKYMRIENCKLLILDSKFTTSRKKKPQKTSCYYKMYKKNHLIKIEPPNKERGIYKRITKIEE